MLKEINGRYVIRGTPILINSKRHWKRFHCDCAVAANDWGV